MEKQRPTAVLVIAILHFVFAALGVCGLISLAVQPAMQAAQPADQQRLQREMEAKMAEKIPGYQAQQVGDMAVNILFTIMLFAAGLGLLQMQNWARLLSIVYAVLSLLHKAFMLVFGLVFVQPVLSPLMNEVVAQSPDFQKMDPKQVEQVSQLMSTAITTGMVCCPLVMMVYPVVVLIVMMLPGVRRAFQGGPRDFDRRDDDLDAGFERERPY
jgi:hypothetical protein